MLRVILPPLRTQQTHRDPLRLRVPIDGRPEGHARLTVEGWSDRDTVPRYVNPVGGVKLRQWYRRRPSVVQCRTRTGSTIAGVPSQTAAAATTTVNGNTISAAAKAKSQEDEELIRLTHEPRSRQVEADEDQRREEEPEDARMDHPLCVRGTTAPSKQSGSIAMRTAARPGSNRAAQTRRRPLQGIARMQEAGYLGVASGTQRRNLHQSLHTARTHTHSQSVRVKIVHGELEQQASGPCLARCTS